MSKEEPDLEKNDPDTFKQTINSYYEYYDEYLIMKALLDNEHIIITQQDINELELQYQTLYEISDEEALSDFQEDIYMDAMKNKVRKMILSFYIET